MNLAPRQGQGCPSVTRVGNATVSTACDIAGALKDDQERSSVNSPQTTHADVREEPGPKMLLG